MTDYAYSYAAAGQLPPAEVLDLYDSVGWSAYTANPGTLLQALAGSATVAVAHSDGKLVGLARVISDGATICYLQDILVHPTHRRSGVGKELAALVLAPYDGVRQKVLLTDNEPGQRSFYEELGFVRSTEFPGAPLNAFVRFD